MAERRASVRLQAAHHLGSPQDAHGASAHKALDQRLTLLDTRLGQQPWMRGQAYSLVDLIVGWVIGYTAYIGAPVALHPTTLAWLQKVQARPSMQIDA